MKPLILAAVAALSIGSASAQYTTRPNIYGAPQYGTTTTGPDGIWTTRPNIYGAPQYGTTTYGPAGQSCQTRANIYGQPQYGTTTTCN
jgi:hypothetical protein